MYIIYYFIGIYNSYIYLKFYIKNWSLNYRGRGSLLNRQLYIYLRGFYILYIRYLLICNRFIIFFRWRPPKNVWSVSPGWLNARLAKDCRTAKPATDIVWTSWRDVWRITLNSIKTGTRFWVSHRMIVLYIDLDAHTT